MGAGRFSPTDWDSFSTTKTVGRSTAAVFTSRGLNENLDPKKIKNGIRESRDSTDNPSSTAIIVGLDVTGSMGVIADNIARTGLKTLFTEIYDRRPVSDPHIMFMGIGDVVCDQVPLQVSQFEADIRIADQLTDLYLEGGGGGNACESYTLPWYLAAMHTSIDCFEKRGKKGYLFTIGDEEPPARLSAAELQRVFGSGQSEMSSRDLLDLVSRQYHVFHVIAKEGSHARYALDTVQKKWTDLLGQRALLLDDHTKLSELIVSTIQVVEGETVDDVVKSWHGDTALVVSKALSGFTAMSRSPSSEVVRL